MLEKQLKPCMFTPYWYGVDPKVTEENTSMFDESLLTFLDFSDRQLVQFATPRNYR